MFDVFYSGKKPNLFAFEKPADDLKHAATLCRTKYYWFIYGDNDYSKFDFEWRPAPWESQYVHVWSTQWHQYGGAYFANTDTVQDEEWKFHTEIVPINKSTENYTILHEVSSFDFTWRPHPFDPPYIYVFGNQWYGPEQMPTIEYHVSGATERKYLYEPQATLPVTQHNWRVNSDVPVEFDFSWCPDPHDPPYIYVFGNQHWEGERSSTVEYHVTGATERKFVGEIRAKLSTLDIFYVDYLNPNSSIRFDALKEQYPHIERIRYANSIMATIARCCTRSKTARFWVISSKNNYTQFDFDWQPDPWQHTMTHVFPSQWNKWSDTFLINRWEFERHNKWAKGLEEFPNLNFVNNQQVLSGSDGSNIYYVDYGNITPIDQLGKLKKEYPKIRVTRFVDNYLDIFKRIMSTAETEYVWIISSICDYEKFDFTWHPEAWQAEMIHVFPSGSQRRGDTFYIHVESFKEQMYELEILDWFNVINYCKDQVVYRFQSPAITYQGDNLVDAVKSTSFNFPYAMFVNEEDSLEHYYDNPCLWAAKDRMVIPLTARKSSSLIPREARNYVETQIYDYPYIEDTGVVRTSQPLDIIFISNGEPDEELMFHHTEYMTNSDVKWIRGVNGRVAAYQAAARVSTTPWFFAVFAKLEVAGGSFPWYRWQPDYWQEPKHYIFNAQNPVNGLVYGHQGMIAYNKKLVLENNHPGIDFTLSQPHESVPLLSGVARFNQDPWMTWRTAFREVIKLKHFMDTTPTIETEHRLNTWLTVANGDFAEWCLRGASDAIKYYDEVCGDYDKLMLSFEWEWLHQRFKPYNI
ncbi:hypothetical protein UFOVP257_405 [uncultured Caudovirales phage]|uniref:Uncharacterized protein n=1 Tax=uncultured Caudovirales phage TaxID=2100421 RepID=A0A6J5LK21_9CAUD|nr:hypothetical protein UFOVP257_405 [uncultured Caudovirales phage]